MPIPQQTPATPRYLALHGSGELARRIARARERLSPCRLCPRECGVDRLAGETGFCRTGAAAVVSSFGPHFGEEDPLVGEGGSGAIFFTNCNLGCLFCQNYGISHLGEGDIATAAELAAIMVGLQRQGCHNINFVTPSHQVPQILAALPSAVEQGLSVPLVYNSSGYDAVETLRLLDGIIDIYMPDFKFWAPSTAKALAHAPDYPERAREAISEMHRQMGDLVMDDQGHAMRGLLLRHLVMPGQLEETRAILQWVADTLSPATYSNIMDQYRPCYRAAEHPGIDRPLRQAEYAAALDLAREAGLTRLDQRNWLRLLLRLSGRG